MMEEQRQHTYPTAYSASDSAVPNTVGPVFPYNHALPTTLSAPPPTAAAGAAQTTRLQQQETASVRERPAPSTFPQRLMEILSDESISDIIQWLPHGKGFIVLQKKRFANEVMPKYFSYSTKYTSFTRKLNRWNFTRITRGPELGAYYHKLFQRDNPKLCLRMGTTASTSSADSQQQLQQHSSAEPMNPHALGLATPAMLSLGLSSLPPPPPSSAIPMTAGATAKNTASTSDKERQSNTTTTTRASISEAATRGTGTKAILSASPPAPPLFHHHLQMLLQDKMSGTVRGKDRRSSPIVGEVREVGGSEGRAAIGGDFLAKKPAASPITPSITPSVGDDSTQEHRKKRGGLVVSADLLYSSATMTREGMAIKDLRGKELPKSIGFPLFDRPQPQRDTVSSIGGSSNTSIEKVDNTQPPNKGKLRRQDEKDHLLLFKPSDTGSLSSSSEIDGSNRIKKQRPAEEVEQVDSLLLFQHELQNMKQHYQEASLPPQPQPPPEPPDSTYYYTSLSERNSSNNLNRTESAFKKNPLSNDDKEKQQRRRIQDKHDPLIMTTPSESGCSSSDIDVDSDNQYQQKEDDEEQVDALLLAQQELQLMQMKCSTPGDDAFMDNVSNDALRNNVVTAPMAPSMNMGFQNGDITGFTTAMEVDSNTMVKDIATRTTVNTTETTSLSLPVTLNQLRMKHRDEMLCFQPQRSSSTYEEFNTFDIATGNARRAKRGSPSSDTGIVGSNLFGKKQKDDFHNEDQQRRRRHSDSSCNIRERRQQNERNQFK